MIPMIVYPLALFLPTELNFSGKCLKHYSNFEIPTHSVAVHSTCTELLSQHPFQWINNCESDQ